MRIDSTRFLLGVERATGVLGWNSTTTTTGVDNPGIDVGTLEIETSGTEVAFLGGGSDRNPYALPRVGFDVMLGGGFTLGGSLTYLVSSGERKVGINSPNDLPTVTTFILSPRVGVLLKASPAVGVWLRGGITRVSVVAEQTAEDDFSGEQLSLTNSTTLGSLALEPMLVVLPVPHVGITFGAALDIGLSGVVVDEQSNFPKVESDAKFTSYGATAGLLAMF